MHSDNYLNMNQMSTRKFGIFKILARTKNLHLAVVFVSSAGIVAVPS